MNDLIIEKGNLLMPTSLMGEGDFFYNSVVLLSEHSDKGSVGFIVNRELNISISDVLPDVKSDFKVYQGGPVEQNFLYYLHRIPQLLKGSVPIDDKGNYWGGDFEILRNLLNSNRIKTNEIRFFLGYTGWSKSQLKQELDNNYWIVSDNIFENILDKII